ncbi:MAG: hypothetical protein ACYSU0_04810 [Planctomycetota bacterium]
MPEEVRCLKKLELDVRLGNSSLTFAPSDRHDATDADGNRDGFAARAVFISPSSGHVRVPAFFCRAGGEWHLLVRFAPEEPGEWRVRVEAADARGNAATSGWKAFRASPSRETGFLRTPRLAGVARDFPPDILVARRGSEYEPFFGVATARAWNAPATPDTPTEEWPGQVIDLERDLFAPMRQSGVNMLIYWFAPWETQLVHRGPGAEPWKRFDQERARRMDEVVRLAEAYSVKLVLNIWPHPALREGDRPWRQGVWNSGPAEWQNGFSAFGGGLSCSDFFKSDDGAEGRWRELWLHQRNLLRYIVARWGYSPAVGLWSTVCLPQGMTGWRDRRTFERWHGSVVRCLRHYDFVNRPLTLVSWREPIPWVGGEEEVDVAQFCVYPKWFYRPKRTMLDAEMRRWIVDRMYSSTLSARGGRPWKPVFCGEYALIERLRPEDTLSTHGRRYPEYMRLASWAALVGGAAILPAEWNDGARFGEHVGRDQRGRLLYDNFAELAGVRAFVKGNEGVPGDFPLNLARPKRPVDLPGLGETGPLALSLREGEHGILEMIAWVSGPARGQEGSEDRSLRLSGLVPSADYEGSFRSAPGGTVKSFRLSAGPAGVVLLLLPEFDHSLAFKLRYAGQPD